MTQVNVKTEGEASFTRKLQAVKLKLMVKVEVLTFLLRVDMRTSRVELNHKLTVKDRAEPQVEGPALS
jgi:hypothetical protein